MINLKLADYGQNKDKFERFLELGADFVYGGNYIFLDGIDEHYFSDEKNENGETGLDFLQLAGHELYSTGIYKKDEIDPLNRFKGLFNGRTYGEGRFVLMCQLKDKDDLYEDTVICAKPDQGYSEILGYGLIQNDFMNISKTYPRIWKEACGNLHQNPELYERAR